jgi:hypothetical protein
MRAMFRVVTIGLVLRVFPKVREFLVVNVIDISEVTRVTKITNKKIPEKISVREKKLHILCCCNWFKSRML